MLIKPNSQPLANVSFSNDIKEWICFLASIRKSSLYNKLGLIVVVVVVFVVVVEVEVVEVEVVEVEVVEVEVVVLESN